MHANRLAILLALLAPACDNEDTGLHDEPVEISFEARVGAEPFACGMHYTGLGSDGASATPQDLRFYVYDVRLTTEDGGEHPVELEDDGLYQGGGVAMLDFEDGAGDCANGTKELNQALRGTVRATPRHGGAGAPAYTGLRFRIGVPEELNHGDLTKLPSPLNDTTMSWSWNAGHIFFAAWGVFGTDAPYKLGVHVGSTGCEGDAMLGEVVACKNGFRPEIVLEGFDPGAGKVVVDWGALWSELSLAAPSDECEERDGETTCGCHSFGPEALCSTLFTPLGLNWQSGAETREQSIFRAL